MKKHIVVLAIAVVVALGGAAPALAAQNQNQGSSSGSSSSGNSNAGTGTGNTDSADGGTGSGDQTQSGQSSDSGQGLSSARKQTCEDRKANIDKTMTQYSVTVQNRLMLFDKITERIRTYYEDNKLSIGEYEQLMAQVTTMQQTATEATNQVREGASIDCGSSDPIGTAQQFKANIQTAQQALQQYRLAIHNLLTAVINAAEASEE